MTVRHKALGRNRGAHAAGLYIRGDVVSYLSDLYSAKDTFTATSTFDPTKWDLVLDIDTGAVAAHVHTGRVGSGILSTVGAGKPSFLGRVNGDLHYDTLIGREFVHTGVASADITDTLSRVGNLGGSLTETGNKTWTVTNNGTTFNNGWTVDGSKAVHDLAVGSPFAQIDMGAGDIDFTVTFTKGSGDAQVGCHQTSDTFASNAGYYISIRENFTEFYNGATYLGTFGGGNAVGSTKTFRIVRSAGIVYYYVDGVLVTQATAAAATGTRITVVDGSSSGGTAATFDNVSALSSGTLAWQYVEPVYLQAQLATGDVATGTHVLKPGLRVPVACQLREVVLRCETAPVGASITVQVERFNNGVSQGIIATASIPTGENVGSVVGLSADCAKGDILKFNITSVGSTTAGADLSVSLDFR